MLSPSMSAALAAIIAHRRSRGVSFSRLATHQPDMMCVGTCMMRRSLEPEFRSHKSYGRSRPEVDGIDLGAARRGGGDVAIGFADDGDLPVQLDHLGLVRGDVAVDHLLDQLPVAIEEDADGGLVLVVAVGIAQFADEQ